MTLTLILFLAGFFVLVKGAKWIVRGSISLARFLKVPGWVIGAVIVGVGTSLPEFAITIASSFDGNAIGLGTIIGSNTFNLLGILGITALIAPLSLPRRWFTRDFLFNAGAVLSTIALAHFAFLGDTHFAGIARPEALLLLILFGVWVWFNMAQHDVSEKDSTQEKITVMMSAFLVVAGLIGVVLGGKFVVEGAEALARLFEVSETLIAILIIGPGTSLPELSVTVTAAIRKQTGLAIGNIVGSNVFDFWGILGVAALLKPIAFPSALLFDAFVTFGAVVLVLVAGLSGKTPDFRRRHGLLFLAVYAAYLIFLGVRG